MNRSVYGGNRFVFAGGPGAGKTTVLDALQQRGYTCIADTARRIIRTRLAAGLSPRPAPAEFAQAILDVEVENFELSSSEGPMLFDRGIVDVLPALAREKVITASQVDEYLDHYPYNSTVFMFPPWEAIYTTDSERDQTFEEAASVYQSSSNWYARCGYDLLEVPPSSIAERVLFVEQALARLTD